jgi:hypothetical protein
MARDVVDVLRTQLQVDASFGFTLDDSGVGDPMTGVEVIQLALTNRSRIVAQAQWPLIDVVGKLRGYGSCRVGKSVAGNLHINVVR